MKKILLILLIPVLVFTGSCTKFLDVVPDNTPEINQAFNLRVMAQRFLATCYNRLPSNTYLGGDNYLIGDEFWLNSTANFSSGGYPGWYIAMGQQNSNAPLLDWWGRNGGNNGGAYWQAINDCNVLIERIHEVPDMDDWEKETWKAEVKVLKAYYHYLLLRAYGPIIIRDKNISVNTDPAEMQEARVPVDQCFEYIVSTIDEAMPELMSIEQNGNLDVGRITQIVAKAIKAKVLVEAASPLFNGNTDMASLKDENGNPLFNQTFDENKWTLAAAACKEAIDFAETNGKHLNIWNPSANLTINAPSTVYQMSLRTAFNESDGNAEALWFDTRSVANASFQATFTPRGFNSNTVSNGSITSYMGATLNMAEKFYSKNGVPIEEDATYPYASRFDLVTVPNTDDYRYDLQVNYTTINFHLDRENRFYGTLSFDGGRYFMMSELNDANALNTNYKTGGNVMSYNVINNQATGYMVKKYVNTQNSYGASNAYSARSYAIPVIRLADLYLLYAESLNESQGPTIEAYNYIDSVRARSGLQGVVSSWANYATQPSKPLTKEGLRDIIKRERTIELAFEGKRFWDLRRWKDCVQELNELILGWDVQQRAVAPFYRARPLFNRIFTTKDYFWPISLDELRRNPKLKQNPGW
ncbi:MAG: RagB/SusD family nutrient uptake outer membrane protein [Niabella sp.]